MFTQEDKQEILAAIGGVREIAEGNREAIGSVREIAEGNREAIGSVREIAEGNRKAIEGNREAIVSVREIAEDNREALGAIREDIEDNTEAIAMLADQMEDHRDETRRSFMQLRSYFDRQHLDLEDHALSTTRNEDRKVNRIVEKLHEKRVFTKADRDDVFAMPVLSRRA